MQDDSVADLPVNGAYRTNASGKLQTFKASPTNYNLFMYRSRARQLVSLNRPLVQPLLRQSQSN